uniref:SEL1L2 adaptor subunit of SYVN1 ubiquitin ligase n=1 Tax=Naja naja TaxID=35670 RepID=A0A8C7E271_NAJNA
MKTKFLNKKFTCFYPIYILKRWKNERQADRANFLSEKQSQKVMERLAADMLFGYNGPQNVKAAVSLYKLLAEEGSHKSQTALGFLSSYGIGVEYNQAKAVVYYTFASVGGNLISQMIMGYRYWLGINVPKNCEAALTNYKEVAKFVANKLEKNEDIPVERVKLMERPENLSINEEFLDWDLHQYFRFLAERGNTRIQKAFYYFLKAANAGNAYGMAFVGKVHILFSEIGLGLLIFQNYTEAFRYFQKAAEKGYDNAQFQLGVMYYGGLGVRRDFKLAFKYFYLAFENGHLLAVYYLAQMYAEGTGVFKSCQIAVEVSSSNNLLKITIMFLQVIEPTADIHLARRWYDLAAETTPDAVMPVFLAYIKLETMHVLTYLPLLNVTDVHCLLIKNH